MNVEIYPWGVSKSYILYYKDGGKRMKEAKFRTENTVYVINSIGIYRDNWLAIKAEDIEEHCYFGAIGDQTEPCIGAVLYVHYNNPATGSLRQLRTTRIIELIAS